MSRTEKFLFITALLFAAFKAGVFIWAAGFGLDATDESFLLNGYRYWKQYNTFDYFRVLNLFFNTAGISVAQFRIARTGIEIFSALVLALSFYRWYNFYATAEKKTDAPLWLIIFCVATAICQSVIFRMLSYNEVVCLLMSVSWASLLLAETQTQNWVSVAAYTFTGLLTALMFFVKPPAAVIELALLVWYTLSRALQQKKFAVNNAAGFLTGVLIFVAVYPGVGHSFSAWFQNFLSLVLVYRNLEYSPGLLVYLWFEEFFYYGMFLSVPTAIVWALERGIGRRWFILFPLHVLLAAASAWYAEYAMDAHSYHRFLHYTILIFGVLVYWLFKLRFTYTNLCWSSVKNFFSQHSSRTLLILLLLHFVVVGGSTVSLSEMFYIFITPALLFLVVPAYAEKKVEQGIQYQTLLGVLLLLMVFNFCYFNIGHAYGLSGNLIAQTNPVMLAEKITVDTKTEKMFEELNSALAKSGFKKGAPVISLDYLCGIAHLVGGYSPACPCYVPGTENKMNFNCHYLQSIPPETLPDTLAVLYTNPQSRKLMACVPSRKGAYQFTFTDSVFNAYSLNAETKEMMGAESDFIKVGFLVMQSGQSFKTE